MIDATSEHIVWSRVCQSPVPPRLAPEWSGVPDGAFRPDADFTDEQLALALRHANLPILLGSLALLTGDDRWIEDPYLPTAPPDLGDHDTGGFEPELAERIRREASATLRAWRDGDLDVADAPAPERLSRILSVMLAERLPDDYGQLLGEEMGLYRRHSVPRSTPTDGFRVAIIGAGGISGLAMAIRLQQAGIDYVLIDKNDDVGGTWHENVYPGCGGRHPPELPLRPVLRPEPGVVQLLRSAGRARGILASTGRTPRHPGPHTILDDGRSGRVRPGHRRLDPRPSIGINR